MKSLLKDELDQMWETFDYKWFVSNDPIQMLHKIRRVPDSSIADIEICAMLIAMVSWGQPNRIIYAANVLM